MVLSSSSATAAPFETFGLSGGQMGAPTVNPMGGWVGKIIGGVIGQQTNLPNIAGSAQPPKQPKQDQSDQQDPNAQQGSQGPTGSKDDPMHVNVTNQPPQPQGQATSAANL